MEKSIVILGSVLFSFSIQAATTCPVEECMSCGTDCLAYVTTLYDQSGQNLTWADGQPQQKLTIIGTGQMTNFKGITNTSSGHDYGSTAPWDQYWNTVKEVDISGVESIGNFAFRHFMKVTDITTDDSVHTIGYGAFNYLPNIQNINLSNTLTTIDQKAFMYTPLKDLVIPASATQISGDIFDHASIQSLYCAENQMALCRELLANRGYTDEQINNRLKAYENLGGQYMYQGKFYANPNDILSNSNIKKRIYTVQEASKLSNKNKNTFKIRYK